MKIELFDELFSCYFSTIYHVLREASRKELTDAELRKLVLKASDYYGFPATTSFIIGGAIDAGKNEEAVEDKDAWPFFDRIERMAIAERHYPCCYREYRSLLENSVPCARRCDTKCLDSECPSHQECARPQDRQDGQRVDMQAPIGRFTEAELYSPKGTATTS